MDPVGFQNAPETPEAYKFLNDHIPHRQEDLGPSHSTDLDLALLLSSKLERVMLKGDLPSSFDGSALNFAGHTLSES